MASRRRFAVAFSGGADSTALLAALHESGLFEVRALHFNHRISAESGAWQHHCEELCERLGLPIVSGVWNASPGPVCTEVDAREARYRWLSDELVDGEVLLTAHHADDQAETVLLNLLQGRGLHRLGGMTSVRPLNQHLLVRPLLGVSRRALVSYLRQRNLNWIEDPANFSDRHQRSFLRQRIMPLLRAQFAQCDENLTKAAARLQEANCVMEQCLGEILTEIQQPDRRRLFCLADPIAVERLLVRDVRVGRNLIRHWVHQAAIGAPGDRELDELLRQLHAVDSVDSHIGLRFNGAEILLHDRGLFLLDRIDNGDQVEQVFDAAPACIAGHLEIVLEPATDPGLSAKALSNNCDLRWRWRRGGERVRMPGKTHSQSLKKLYQEYQIPRFERDALPLLWAGDELLWINGIGFSDCLSTLSCRGSGDDNFKPVFRTTRGG